MIYYLPKAFGSNQVLLYFHKMAVLPWIPFLI